MTLTQLAALTGLTEGAIRWRTAHGHLTPPAYDGTFDRVQALAEANAKPKQRGGRRSGQRTGNGAEHTPDSLAAEVRYRVARADREEQLAARLRADTFTREAVFRTIDALEHAKREAALEIPAAEADALTEAMAQDCTVGTAKRELERIMRAYCERVSAMAFKMAEEQPK